VPPGRATGWPAVAGRAEAGGCQPHHAGTQPLAGIVEGERKSGLADASGQRRQRTLLVRADFAEKGQRQVQVICGHRPSGIFRKVRRAPVNDLPLGFSGSSRAKNSLFGSDMIETR
jgi:hypothetical protein